MDRPRGYGPWGAGSTPAWRAKREVYMYYRWFKCTVCGQKVMAPKYNSHDDAQTIGHIKTMYCPMCHRKQDFVLYDVMAVKGKHKGRLH